MATEHRAIKYLHVPLLILTNTVSIILLCLLNHRFIGRLPLLVSQHRDITAIVVQVLASILAVSQVHVLCSIINFATRLHAFRRSISTRSIRLLAALSIPRVDWTLDGKSIAITVSFCLVAPVLGAVWAAALTPLLTTSIRRDGSIQIPLYRQAWNNNASWWYDSNGNVYLQDCTSFQFTPTISISRCPGLDMIDLVANGRGATTQPGIPRIYPKVETPIWSYSNRSYGVGAAQGLFLPTNESHASYSSYSYQEPGYQSVVTCEYNATSNLTVTPQSRSSSDVLVLWQVEGNLPNAAPDNSITYTLATANTLWYNEILAWSAAASNGRNMLAMATGTVDKAHWYTGFNTMQCSIIFQPTLYTVTVNNNQSTINVLPTGTSSDFEKTGSLQASIMDNLDLISRISSNIGGSSLGATLSTNFHTLQQSELNLSNTVLYQRASENMISALIDDLLVAVASMQMTRNKSTSTTPLLKHFNAVRLGSPGFIYAAMAINFALVVLVLVEAARTKSWHNLPAFNITNFQHVIAAALESSASKNDGQDDRTEDNGLPLMVEHELETTRLKWIHDSTGTVVMLVDFDRNTIRKRHNSSSTMLKQFVSESQEPLTLIS